MRIYDDKYLSVTSVIGLKDPFNRSSFENWCRSVFKDPDLVLDTATTLGSKVSNLIEYRTSGLDWIVEPPIDIIEENLYSAVEDFLSKCEVLECEGFVKNEELNYAGRFDGMIKLNGEQILADWKTYGAWKDKPYKRDSAKIKHARWQLTMYAKAMDWKGALAVVIFKNDGTWELERVKFDKKILDWVSENQDLILETIKNGEKSGSDDCDRESTD